MGSILGSAIDLGLGSFDTGIPKNNGMAPGAKVAFTDVFNTPHLDDKEMFVSAYLLGARIHTNSWGSEVVDNSYTSQSSQYDRVAYENPDYLILFAASNDGRWSQYGATVGAPATCKNCLSVGAASGAVEDAQATGKFPRLMIGDTEVSVKLAAFNDPTRLYFSGPSIFLQDYCLTSIQSLSGFIAVLDAARAEECDIIDQVRCLKYCCIYFSRHLIFRSSSITLPQPTQPLQLLWPLTTKSIQFLGYRYHRRSLLSRFLVQMALRYL